MRQPSRAERRRRAREASNPPEPTGKDVTPRPPVTPPPATVRQRTPRGRGQRRGMLWWLLGAAALVIIAVGTWWAISSRTAAQGTGNLGEQLPSEGRDHVDNGATIEYRAQPPASGKHYPSPAPAGVYPGGLLAGFWVHSLEHGYIVLAYKPPVSPEMLRQFDDMVRDFPKSKHGFAKLVVVPYTVMPHPYAVLAWTWRLWLDSFDRQKVLEFYRAHVDHGPEDVP